jgi:uncharacterized protein (TIGR03067 family)
MRTTPMIHFGRMPLGILFVFAALSLEAQAPDDSTFSLSPGDVTEATIHTSGPARLQVTLTPEKREELSTFTGRNLNKQVKIVVGGKLRSEPFIRERIAGPSLEIFVSSPEDALATVKTLLTSKVAFEQLHKWTDSDGRTHYSEKPPPPASDPRPDAAPVAEDKNAFQALQGSWGVVKATMNGKESRDASLLEGIWTFKGNELVLQSRQEGRARFTLKMDAKAEPKAFHLTPVEPATEASGWMLFSREGERLKIAFHDNLKGRPESFEPRGPRSERELIVVILSPKK